MRFSISFLKKSMQFCTVEIGKKDPVGFLVVLLLFCQVKLGHRYSQISTDIWLFVAFNILVIRVHPCPQKRKFLYSRVRQLKSKQVDCPTPTGFIIGRWFVASEKDVAAVNAIQKQVTMTPLSHYGKSYTPPKVKVVPAKKYTGDLAFFEQLGDTLAINGAPAADAGLLGLFKEIGLSVDHGFDPSALSDGEKKSLAHAVKDGESMLAAKSAGMGKDVNGWQLSPVLDEYFGTSYLFRAAIGYQAMFVNTPIEAYYPGVFKDTDGKVLDGSSGKYTIKFPKGKTPPTGAFWSVTLYDAKKRLMVENSLNRYKIGSADKLKADADGSTTLYIQADSPGKDKESNWLPAPKEPFYMLMRMYLPKIEVLNGQYEIPGVVKAK